MQTILTSAVIAALVAALFTVLTSERRIAAENVIQERKRWRDKIRRLASDVQRSLVLSDVKAATLNELRAKFSLLINPHENADDEILRLIAPGNANRADEFTQRVALLLKHDWERAKREASLWRRLWEKPPRRVALEDYRPGSVHDYRVWRLTAWWLAGGVSCGLVISLVLLSVYFYVQRPKGWDTRSLRVKNAKAEALSLMDEQLAEKSIGQFSRSI